MPSVVAGIVGKDGAFRLVIETERDLPGHVHPGERLYLLPNVLVIEPISNAHGYDLIERMRAHIARLQ